MSVAKFVLIMQMLNPVNGDKLHEGWYLTNGEVECNALAHLAGQRMLKDGLTFDFRCVPIQPVNEYEQ